MSYYYETRSAGSVYKSEGADAQQEGGPNAVRSLSGSVSRPLKTNWVLRNVFEVDGKPQSPPIQKITIKYEQVESKPQRINE